MPRPAGIHGEDLTDTPTLHPAWCAAKMSHFQRNRLRLLCLTKSTHQAQHPVHLNLQGPRLELSSLRLLMECPPGQTAATVLTARNTGTTALFYTWELQSLSNREGPQRFLLSDQKGMILPGAFKDFRCQQSSACTPHMYMQQILSCPLQLSTTADMGQACCCWTSPGLM